MKTQMEILNRIEHRNFLEKYFINEELPKRYLFLKTYLNTINEKVRYGRYTDTGLINRVLIGYCYFYNLIPIIHHNAVIHTEIFEINTKKLKKELKKQIEENKVKKILIQKYY
jgi:hypothetical protein